MAAQGMVFTFLEMLQIVALLPCLFAIGLLLILNQKPMQILIPLLFFVALACSFFIGLAGLLFAEVTDYRYLALVWMESMQPALCFLLIMQLWRNAFPSVYYWMILALPVIGGASLVYASLQLDNVCLLDDYCLQSEAFRTLYYLFATSLIFLLLVVHLARTPIANTHKTRYQSHRYWLMISLISLYVALLAIDLAWLTNSISGYQQAIIEVVIQIAFLYLVVTSLFRVFDWRSQQEAAAYQPKPIDQTVLSTIREAMEGAHLYREMGFNRERCAQELGMPEHVLSRAINQAFGRNFNEFVNGYRVEEAKERLAKETTSITAIAFEVGFSSIASFNRVFKTMTGCSPTEFRAAAQPVK